VTAIEGLSALTTLTLLELGSNRVRNIEGLEVSSLVYKLSYFDVNVDASQPTITGRLAMSPCLC
jgi:hypothetical protein